MPKRALGTLLMVVAVAGCGAIDNSQQAVQPPGGPASADPSALAAADSAVAALGGWESWSQARFLTFDFIVERDGEVLRRTTHLWDRFSNQCRMRGENSKGESYDVVFDMETHDGSVELAGESVTDSTREEWLERAYATLINDSYWLLMPYKMHDPGVHLSDEGARTDSTGKSWRVIQLSFDQDVGLTSKDHYWVYLDPETYRVGRWDYHLEGMKEEDTPLTFSWGDWQQVGPLWLSLEKRGAGSPITIRFENVEVQETVPEGTFS